jgi:hypothetical protein
MENIHACMYFNTIPDTDKINCSTLYFFVVARELGKEQGFVVFVGVVKTEKHSSYSPWKWFSF